MFQEGNKACGDGDDLLRRNVDVLDLLGFDFLEVSVLPGFDAFFQDKLAVLVPERVGLGDGVFFFFVSGQVDDLVRHFAVFNFEVRRFHEAVLVGLHVGAHGSDKTDVGAFRSLDRADAAVMAVVHVADLQTGAVSVQAAGAQSGQAALVGELGQGIQLIHELGKLGAAEEIAHKVGEDPRIDEFLRLRDLLLLTGRLVRHAVFYIAVHPGQGDAALVSDEFADRTDAAVAKVVDVVRFDIDLRMLGGFFLVGNQIKQIRQSFHYILFVQGGALHLFFGDGKPQLFVEFVASDVGEIVGSRFEKEASQNFLSLFLAERFAGLEAVVDLAQGFFAAVVGNIVLSGRFPARIFPVLFVDHVKDRRTGRSIVDLDALDAGFEEVLKDLLGQFRGFFKGDVADSQLLSKIKAFEVGVVGLGDLAVADLVEKVEKILVSLVAQSSQKRGRPDSAPGMAAVDADVNVVRLIADSLKPGAAVRNKREPE